MLFPSIRNRSIACLLPRGSWPHHCMPRRAERNRVMQPQGSTRVTACQEVGVRPDFAAHRRRVLEQLPEDEAVLLFGAPEHRRNGDSEYRYRPDSALWWLSGWEDPDVALFLRPGAEPFTLFVQPKD